MKRFSSHIGAFWLFSLFAFPCVIILSTHYVKLLSNTTAFPPKEYIRIDISRSESLQRSQILYPGLWILKSLVQGSGVLDPESWVLGPGSQISGPGVPGLESWGPGSWFLILDYGLITLQRHLFTEVIGNRVSNIVQERLYKGLSKKSYSGDVNAIKNSSSKH